MAVSTAYTGRELVWLFLLAGLVALGVKTMSSRTRFVVIATWSATLGLSEPASKHWALCLFFLKSSLFVFGSRLAIVPFLHVGFVESHHSLHAHPLLDPIAVPII